MAGSLPALDISLLFVYGTLRRGFALHHHLRRMGAEFVATGKVQAELSDSGKFPGARKSTKRGKIVEGEVYRLRRAENALKVLDQVEGYSPKTPGKSLFQRATAEVALPNGERRVAWIYWLNKRASVRARGPRFVYSSTTSCPFIFACPIPQKWEQSKGKVPTLSAVNSMVVARPFSSNLSIPTKLWGHSSCFYVPIIRV